MSARVQRLRRIGSAPVIMVAHLLLSACGVSSVDATLQSEKLGAEAAPQTAFSPPPGPLPSGTQSKPQANATSAAKRAADALTASARPDSKAYKIGQQDVLEISVFKVAELSKTVQVSDAGTINLPLLGETQASGKTAREVEQDLTKQLGKKYLENPQVSVFIKEYNSQRVTVDGAVKKPGVFPIKGNMTLLQVLAVAQGLDTLSDSTVIIFRNQQGERSAAHFDVTKIRSGAQKDPQLNAGDVVVAGKSATKEAFENVMKALRFTSVFALL